MGGSRERSRGRCAARELEVAAASGCDFALLAPIWRTSSKPEVIPLGLDAAGELTAAARLPVVWLGGVSPENVAQLRELEPRRRPAGLATIGALMSAADPEQVARALLDELRACALDPERCSDDAAGA